jgi:hypothetical protein
MRNWMHPTYLMVSVFLLLHTPHLSAATNSDLSFKDVLEEVTDKKITEHIHATIPFDSTDSFEVVSMSGYFFWRPKKNAIKNMIKWNIRLHKISTNDPYCRGRPLVKFTFADKLIRYNDDGYIDFLGGEWVEKRVFALCRNMARKKEDQCLTIYNILRMEEIRKDYENRTGEIRKDYKKGTDFRYIPTFYLPATSSLSNQEICRRMNTMVALDWKKLTWNQFTTLIQLSAEEWAPLDEAAKIPTIRINKTGQKILTLFAEKKGKVAPEDLRAM